MAVFNKIADFVERWAEGVHDLQSDSLVLALSNTAPGAEASPPTGDGNGVLANVTQITYTNCSSRALTVSSSAQTGGTYKLVVNDLVLTATGGAVGPFRYVYIYNDTPVAPADPLIGYYDYGSSVTLADTETMTVDFDGVNGVLTLV